MWWVLVVMGVLVVAVWLLCVAAVRADRRRETREFWVQHRDAMAALGRATRE